MLENQFNSPSLGTVTKAVSSSLCILKNSASKLKLGSTLCLVVALSISNFAFAKDQIELSTKSEQAELKGKTFIIGTDTSFAPFTTVNSKGKVEGIDIDIMRELAKRGGFEVKFYAGEFTHILDLMENKEIDGILSGFSYTQERAKYCDYSEPYYISEFSLVTRIDKDVSSLQDVANLQGAAKIDSLCEEILERKQAKYNFTIEHYESGVESLLSVQMGINDFVLEDYPVAEYSVSSDLYPSLKVTKIELSKEHPINYYFAVPKGKNKDLLDYFNQQINVLKDDGTFQKIVDYYLNDQNLRVAKKR